MKYINLILCFLLISCSSLKWSKKAKVAYGVMWTTQTVDYMQTLSVCDDKRFSEGNGLTTLETEHIMEYIILSNLIILGIAYFIPDDWRVALFYTKAGVNIGNAWHNVHTINNIENGDVK